MFLLRLGKVLEEFASLCFITDHAMKFPLLSTRDVSEIGLALALSGVMRSVVIMAASTEKSAPNILCPQVSHFRFVCVIWS